MTEPPLDLLAIAAHPDDAELTCGGTLARAAEQGHRTGILDLTRGEMGSRGTPELRAEEADRAAAALGVGVRVNAGLPDARLENSLEARRDRGGAPAGVSPPATVILPYGRAGAIRITGSPRNSPATPVSSRDCGSTKADRGGGRRRSSMRWRTGRMR